MIYNATVVYFNRIHILYPATGRSQSETPSVSVLLRMKAQRPDVMQMYAMLLASLLYCYGLHIHLLNSLVITGLFCITALLGHLLPKVNGFL